MFLVIREWLSALGEILASAAISQSASVRDIVTREFGSQNRAVPGAWLGRESFGAYFGGFGCADTVPGIFQSVFGVFSDLLAAFRVVVVENFRGAEAFDKFKVFGRARSYNRVSRAVVRSTQISD